MKIDGEVAELPQYLFMRVAIGIHQNDINAIAETYDLMSQKYFIHALPTLYNAGSEFNYLSSCFLVAMKDDSIDGIFKTLNEAALISKASGGIGIHVHNIRSMARILPAPMGIQTGWYPCCVFTTILQGMSIKVGVSVQGICHIYRAMAW